MRRIRDEGLLLACLALVIAPGFAFGPYQIAQDGFLAILSGKLIVHGGLPSHDTLTVLAHGRRWVDQQWLGQLVAYGAYDLGGLRAVQLLHGLCIAAALGGAAAAARALGGTARATAPIALLAALAVAPIAYTIRTQTYAMPLFVAVLWLVVSDVRTPSRRVFWALPLLVVWCNVHGSIVLGVGVVGLRGLWCLRATPRRALLLIGVALVGLLASPYLPHLADYYRATIFNDDFSRYVQEWQPAKLQISTAAFFALALLAVWFCARHTISWFERIVLLVFAINVMLAVRNLAWFGFAALVILPGLVAREMGPEPKGRGPDLARVVVGVIGALALTIGVLVAAFGTGDRSPRYPAAAKRAIARAIAADPTARIFPDRAFGDWLLLELPQTKGRVVYDSRIELLRGDELRSIFDFGLQSSAHWTRALHGARIVLLERQYRPRLSVSTQRRLLQIPGARQVYEDDWVTVLTLPATASGGSRSS